MERIFQRGPRGGKRKNANADHFRRAKRFRPRNDEATGVSLPFDWARQREAAIAFCPGIYGAALCSPNRAGGLAHVANRKALCRLHHLRTSCEDEASSF